MLIQPIFYAIFYDLDKPKLLQHAMNKRIEKFQYHNLTDDMGTKEVILKDNSRYRIVSIATFHISNTVDNHFFVICDCTKI